MNFRLPPGGIVGIIGPNGAGKTTLLRMFMGQEQPDEGELKIGPTVELGYVDQSRDDLVADHTVYEEISGGHDTLEMGGRKMNSRAYVSRFNFTGPDQQKKVGVLSGGERNRVHLAKLLRRGSNVLLLDEPTNDLDVDTLRALEEAVANFAGCAVVVSHDRWFLDRLATHILAFEGDGYVHWCEGNFQTYEEQRRERLGESADEPKRFRYKKLQHRLSGCRIAACRMAGLQIPCHRHRILHPSFCTTRDSFKVGQHEHHACRGHETILRRLGQHLRRRQVSRGDQNQVGQSHKASAKKKSPKKGKRKARRSRHAASEPVKASRRFDQLHRSNANPVAAIRPWPITNGIGSGLLRR